MILLYEGNGTSFFQRVEQEISAQAFEYIMHLQDDVYLHLGNLLARLEELPPRSLVYMGRPRTEQVLSADKGAGKAEWVAQVLGMPEQVFASEWYVLVINLRSLLVSRGLMQTPKSRGNVNVVNLGPDEVYDFPGLDTPWSRDRFDFPPRTTVAITVRGQWKLLDTSAAFLKDRYSSAQRAAGV